MSAKYFSKSLRYAALLLAVAGISAPVLANPAGRWKTVDDKTGRDRSIVVVDIIDGVLTGRIERSLNPDDPPGAICAKCKGALHNQPIQGMALLSGLKADGDDDHWSGGEIVDPESGESYHAKLSVSPDGKTMEVRGYVGISLFGRSQTWVRTR